VTTTRTSVMVIVVVLLSSSRIVIQTLLHAYVNSLSANGKRLTFTYSVSTTDSMAIGATSLDYTTNTTALVGQVNQFGAM
jgi:hypothetical protein